MLTTKTAPVSRAEWKGMFSCELRKIRFLRFLSSSGFASYCVTASVVRLRFDQVHGHVSWLMGLGILRFDSYPGRWALTGQERRIFFHVVVRVDGTHLSNEVEDEEHHDAHRVRLEEEVEV